MLDFLAHASNFSRTTRGLRYAADVARLFGGSLTGIFVSEPIAPVLGPIGMPAVLPDLYAAEAEVSKEARQAEPTFNAWAQSVGLTRYRWQVANGFFSGALAAAANWHDALFLESGHDTPWSSVGVLGHALIHCGAPCFVVPQENERAARFDTIAIASHGSPESVRAVHAALPYLARAKRIVLIQGAPRETFSAVEFRPPFTIEDHLKTHGLVFSTQTIDATGERVGEAILAAAGDSRADLLVMGAYGRTRFSEWVLGGATRHVLEHAALPLLMRH